jgi:hypothetical protein
MDQKLFAGLGQRDSRFASDKYLLAKVALEPRDRQGERGLGHAQCLCGTGEIALLSGLNKDGEIAR